MDLSDKLTYLMKKNNIKSVLQLSKKSNLPYSTIKDILDRKNVDIKMSTSKKLCDFFDVSLDELFNENIDLK